MSSGFNLTSFRSSDVQTYLDTLSNSSSSSDQVREILKNFLLFITQNDDSIGVLLSKRALEVLVGLYARNRDVKFVRNKVSNILTLLGQNGDSNAASAIESIANIVKDSDFDVFVQCLNGIRELNSLPSGEETGPSGAGAAAGSSSSSEPAPPPPPLAHSLSVTAATAVLTKMTTVLTSSVRDGDKIEALGVFVELVEAYAFNEAVEFATWMETNVKLKGGASGLSAQFFSSLQAFSNALKDISSAKRKTPLCVLGEKYHTLITENNFFPTAVSVVVGDASSDKLDSNLAVINTLMGSTKKYTLLYKASIDGFALPTFHSKCDNKGATVVVITCTEGNVFGGYAAVPWNSNGIIGDNSGESFMFSLKNPQNTPPAKFSLKEKHLALYSDRHQFQFGCCGIRVNNNANTANNNCASTNCYSCYSNTTGLSDITVFTGKHNFTAKEVEVYQVL